MEHRKASLFHFAARPRDAKRESQPLPPDEFAYFIRNKVRLFQRNPPGPSQYNRDEDRYKPKHQEAREDLKRILVAHDEDLETELKVKECSWDTVFEQMAEATRLKSSQKGLGGSALPVGMQIASEVIDIFPEEFGLSVIKGSLALVFEACQRHSENRQKIIEAFETVPDAILTINTAYLFLNPEEDDKDILRTFFTTLVEDLPFLIGKLLGKEKWYKKVASALLLHIPEEAAIDDILEDWATKMTALQERVQGMKIKILSKLGLKIDDLKDQVDTSEKNIIAEIKDSEDILKNQVMNSEAGIVALLSQHKDSIQLMMTRIQYQDEQIRISGIMADKASTAAMTGLLREAQNAYKQAKQARRDKEKSERKLKEKEEELRQKEKIWNEERGLFHQELQHSHRNEAQLRRDEDLYRRENAKLHVHNRELARRISSQSLSDRVHTGAESRAHITPMQLLSVIGVPLDSILRDLDRVAQQAIHFDAESQGKAQWLMKTPEFGNWMQGRRSSILIADGATNGQILLVSPMSGLCAALASGLADDDSGTITLFFFMGLHIGTDSTSHDLDGPQGMMRCLIAQLLSSSLLEPNLGFLTLDDLEAYQRHDLKSLCNLFVRLVQQLPPGTDIFCIIDGISWYEQAPWLTGLRSATGMFEYLMGQLDPDYAAILKVLMTSHGRSREIVQHLALDLTGEVGNYPVDVGNASETVRLFREMAKHSRHSNIARLNTGAVCFRHLEETRANDAYKLLSKWGPHYPREFQYR
ncbi:hypothetical protein NUW58_g1776 [Xylaria curta]|uniref:Uncharacterized protein n=1 Tax=Xylaria curta TaxID=42375 RepID=A0ACC1PKR5_9PEZI|nr:hypothetical protein NUW58_g1776 [Xylaria curta]